MENIEQATAAPGEVRLPKAWENPTVGSVRVHYWDGETWVDVSDAVIEVKLGCR